MTRQKNQGGFPARSLAEVLRLSGVGADEVDLFAAANVHEPTEHDWTREAILRRWDSGGRGPVRRLLKSWRPVMAIQKGRLARNRMKALGSSGLPFERIRVVEHHRCHASAAYHAAGDLNADQLVLTADGLGDYVSATTNIGSDGRLVRRSQVSDEHSLGTLYQIVTFLLGMVPLEHEHKVMGLAPYAGPARPEVRRIRDRFRALFEFTGDGTTWRCTEGRGLGAESVPLIERLLHRERFDRIAGGLQSFLEEFLVEWVRNCIQATGVPRVTLGGGVFMNVKANGRILELPEVESLFVMPSAGDETNCLGAAYAVEAERAGGPAAAIPPLGHLFLGTDLGPKEAEAGLASPNIPSSISWRRLKDPANEVAHLLEEGAVVARATGRMEFGARALGNRSILADPARPEHVRRINEMIKSRDFWMPFAPSVLAQEMEGLFHRPKPTPAPYMALAFGVREEAWTQIQAAAHPADRTARPQEVDATWNPSYHSLLAAFKKRTGRGALLNTSFNLHGEPIVRDAPDALRVFLESDLDYLVLGNLLVWKKHGGAAIPKKPRARRGAQRRHAAPSPRK